MTYWHLQMNQPWGRNGGYINSKDLLTRPQPVIGTGEWNHIQCRYFKDTDPRGLKNGDIVMVHEGQKPIALCIVSGNYFKDPALQSLFTHENFRNVTILGWLDDTEIFPQPQGTLGRLISDDTESWDFIDYYYHYFLKIKRMNELLQILENKKQIILQGPPGTGKTYTAQELAYYILFSKPLNDAQTEREQGLKELENSDQFEFIQFHPAYTYEDFVRGITAKAINGRVTYEAENKLLGDMAQRANENLQDSLKPATEISRQDWLQDVVAQFQDYIDDKLTEKEEKISITPKVYIYRTDDKSIRYIGDIWKVDGGVPLDDLVNMYLADVQTRQEVKHLDTLSKSAKDNATYWFRIYLLFKKFIKDKGLIEPSGSAHQIQEKKYVLIIDEINRANLPAVLGELIFALEYRDRTVKSMYTLEKGGASLIVPGNLYIIGTMNTADRSVGHIDYAIRRRFAFVDVLPNENIVSSSARPIYGKVKSLFVELENGKEKPSQHLAPDFLWKDVLPGHSYFMEEDSEKLQLKIKYEVQPLLREYVKDGILSADVLSTIDHLSN